MRSISEATSARAGCLLSIAFLWWWCVVRPEGVGSEGREAHGAGGILDGHREADADEHALLGGIEDRRDDADHFAVHGDQRATGIAGIGGSIELDQVGED